MVINLDELMQHARSVALVLNLKTGHPSPQFHVTFDPRLEIFRQSLGNLFHTQTGRRCEGSQPCRLPGIKLSSKQLKLNI
jgi:hypothetical protein